MLVSDYQYQLCKIMFFLQKSCVLILPFTMKMKVMMNDAPPMIISSLFAPPMIILSLFDELTQ